MIEPQTDPSAAPSALWRQVFGNDHPVEIEIGPGRGELLIAYASARPHVNFFAIERSSAQATRVATKAALRGAPNVRVIAGDARCVVGRLVPPTSVAAYHIYFPDPWPKRRHHRRRLFTDPTFAPALARTLLPDGRVEIASDLASVLALAADALAAAGLTAVTGALPPGGRATTSFERRYVRDQLHYARFIRTGGRRNRAPAP